MESTLVISSQPPNRALIATLLLVPICTLAAPSKNCSKCGWLSENSQLVNLIMVALCFKDKGEWIKKKLWWDWWVVGVVAVNWVLSWTYLLIPPLQKGKK